MKGECKFKTQYKKKCEKIKKKYPGFKVMYKSNMNKSKCKSLYNGKFPDIKGSKFKYPKQSNCEAWMYLITEALMYRNLYKYCMKNDLPLEKDPNKSQYEYILYHGRPTQIKRRTTRNKHRKLSGLKVGDPRHVHHMDRKNLDYGKTVILTPCEHKRAHGLSCNIKDGKDVKPIKHGKVPRV